MKALVPIKTMASNISASLGDSTGKYEFSIGKHLLSGWREMNLYLNQEFNVRTVILEYDNTVCLPQDFVFETKVGILYNNRLAVLSLDKNVQREKLNQSQSEERVRNIFCGEYSGDLFPFYNCFRGSSFLGELYGFGRGVHCSGYYNIDKKAGEIYIGSMVPEGAEIVIEYKSDGISDGLKLIPSECETALEHWAKARHFESKRDLAMASWHEERYERHYNKLKRLYNFQSALYASAKLNESFSPTNY